MLPTIITESMNIIQPAISTIVSTLFATMFLSRNTRISEIDKLKAGKYKEICDELLADGKMTYYEYFKFGNFLKIAKLADDEYGKGIGKGSQSKREHTKTEFNFDWFLRFFESASNISNEDMQVLWARILSGETYNSGSFSLRTVEMLRNMSYEEALDLQRYSQFRVESPFNEILLLSSKEQFSSADDAIEGIYAHETDDWRETLARIYAISSNETYRLMQIGILLPSTTEGFFTLETSNDDCHSFYNDAGIVTVSIDADKTKTKEKDFAYQGHMFSIPAIELFSVIDTKPSLKYMLDMARLIRYYQPEINVALYKVESIDDSGYRFYDDEKDILCDSSYFHMTSLNRLPGGFLDESRIFVNNETK